MLRFKRHDEPFSLKRTLLPQSLFGRALLILVLPTIIVQLVATYIFYDRHWETVSRWMASSLAGEIALLVHEMNDASDERQKRLALLAQKLVRMDVALEPKDESTRFLRSGKEISPIFFAELQERLSLPFSLQLVDDGQLLRIRVKLDEKVLVITVSRKRLVSSTTYIFISWMIGSALLLTGIAVLFLRNQIRPITKLAAAMDEFGKGVDVQGFRPQGAIEVRRAGRAFLLMRQRIDRQISARMDMLAGISHDLRTPLTRMKLQLEMLKDKETAGDLRRDVSDMEHMIAEYLDFVRGEGQEAPRRTTVQECLEDVRARYDEVPVAYHGNEQEEVYIRPRVFRRALMNLIDNAIRYGTSASIEVRKKRQHIEILIDDRGEGIPRHLHEEVFKPFRRLDQSRNASTGGVGLGLTITRDIIHAHGGDVFLQDAPDGGLRAVVRLPQH